MGGRDWAELALLSLVWGATFVFAKIALVEVGPLTLAAARVCLAALCLMVALRAARTPLPRGARVWAALFGMGALNNAIPFSLIFFGQSLMPPTLAASLAAILNATTPFFAALVAHALTDDEKLTPARLAGLAIGFAGVAAMLAPRLAGASPAADAPHLALGVAACLTAAVVYAFAGVFGRRFARLGVAPMQTAFGQSGAAGVLLVPLALIVDAPLARPLPGAATLAAIVALATVSTAFAYILYFRILARAGASNLLLVTLLIPVSAIGLGVGLLGERLGPEHLVGLAAIALGLALIDGRALRRLRRASPAP
ncbi:MAG: DMT family transporter [Rhizobiales bacterium]|nr:DMT family transporter [Hyphomicrobiales bacterium]